MAERPGELEEITETNRSTADNIETYDLEVGAPVAYTTTDLGAYPNDAGEVAPPVDAAADAEQHIQAQIEQTRNDLGETINAIQEKLSISNITEQVKDEVSSQISGVFESAKQAVFGGAENIMQTVNKSLGNVADSLPPQVSETGAKIAATAKKNPIPFILAGVGVGLWLLNTNKKFGGRKFKSQRYTGNDDDFDSLADSDYTVRESRKSSAADKSTVSQVYEKAGAAANQAFEGVSGAVNSAYEGVSGAAGSAIEGVSNVAGSAIGGVSSVANSAYQGVGTTAGKAYEQVGNLGTHAKKVADWTQDTYSSQLDENPLIVGGVAVALGLAVGFAFPSTEFEAKYMGDARENLVQKAQDTAQDYIEQAKDAAGEYIGQAKKVAGEVTQAVNQEMSKSA